MSDWDQETLPAPLPAAGVAADDATRQAPPPSPAIAPAPVTGTGRSEGQGPGPLGTSPQGVCIGRYLILKALGQGGMGVVYAAYDPELDRKVALKLLRPDSLSAREENRARLLREAQAMARISHPNVVPVFDVGTWQGQVFVAMEFIDGPTLSQWLKQQPRSWQQVLRIFIEAGQGLAAAHGAGLVHRDFKPSNVLVSQSGRACVTDFGLARLAFSPDSLPEGMSQPSSESSTSRLSESVTQAGHVVGTPQYMPPEQYRSEAPEPRSDQFSFCAALYWALYDKRPFDSKHLANLALGRPAPADPIQPPPRELKVPAWVASAIMRGLALDPSQRFPNMQELLRALDLERRRTQRTWALGATAAVGLLAAVGGGVLYRQSQVCSGAEALMAEVWSPTTRQKLEQAFAATQVPQGEAMARQVAQVVEGYAQAWVRQRTEACQATRVQGAQTEELLGRRVVCLERRRKEVRALLEVLAQADGKLVLKSVDAAWALPDLRQCADVEALAQQQALPADPARRAQVEQLGEQLAMVNALLDAGRYEPALELAQALQPKVAATQYLPLQAELDSLLGASHLLLGHKEQAAQLLEQAVYQAEAGRADRLKISAQSQLVYTAFKLGQLDQAERWGRHAEAALTRLGGDALLASNLLGNLFYVASSQGQPAKARQLLERKYELQKQVLPPGNPRRARTTFELGVNAVEMGELPRAVALLTQALQETQAALGPDHPDLANRHGQLSRALRLSGQLDQAREHAEAMLRLRQATFGPQHPAVADAKDELGMILLALQRYSEAREVYDQALQLKLHALGPEDDSLQYSYDGLGQALLGLGLTAEAMEVLQKALTYTSVEPEALAESGYALARALWQQGQHPQARDAATQARERFSQAHQTQRVAELDSWLQQHPAP